MHMYGRRLHLLVDEERYRRLEAKARERGVSVARIVREAIDAALPGDADRRRAAGKRILRAEPMPVPDPADLKKELEGVRSRRA
jgi:hypothetical protein